MRVQSQMAWLCRVIFMGIIGFSLQQKSSLRLAVEPQYLLMQDGRTPATMLCTLRDGAGERVPIAGCQVRHYNTYWDLSRGIATPSMDHIIRGEVVHDRYFGTGLENGDCGQTLTGLKTGYHYIQRCRVRPVAGGDWIYASMLIIVDSNRPMQYRLQPSGNVVALPGSDVNLVASAEHRIDACDFFYPPPNFKQIVLKSDIFSINNTLYRAWREGKRCGITLLAVQPAWSGFIRSTVASDSVGSSSADFIQLIVAVSPKAPPLLTVDSNAAYFTPGDVLNATCVVGKSLPVSNLTWFLGTDVVRNDNWNEAPPETEWKDDMRPSGIKQRLSLQLSLQDDGKMLKCQAGHLALPSLVEESRSYLVRVRVGDPCDPNPCGPHSKCIVSGRFSLCSCLPHFVGQPPSCRPQCDVSADCPAEKACVAHVCQDQCPGDCGQDAVCSVINHFPLCSCPDGSTGDPYELCVEDPCGRREVEPALISGGNDAKKGEFPWHAAIFQVLAGNKHKLRCGGTLVRPNIVITAAHCFYDQTYNRVTSSALVKVVLGKLENGWDVDLNDSDVQRLDVRTISLPADYRGVRDDYRLDIAVVRLSADAILTRHVNVACLDVGLSSNTRRRDQLQAGSVGTVAGWGLTAFSTTPSSILQWIDLPWVDKDTCLANTRLENRRYLTRDKFCAGYANQSMSVCPGDSGGGLVFLNETSNRYFLRGVVSTSLAYSVQLSRCSANDFTTFTSVGEHLEWIKKHVIP